MKVLKVIAWYQILSAILIFVFFTKTTFQYFNLWSLPIYLLGIIFLVYLTFAGYKLLKEPYIGIKYSVFSQLPQMIGFSVPGFVYVFTSASSLSLILGENNFRLNLDLSFILINIKFGEIINQFNLQIFIIPMAIIILLFSIGLRMEKDKIATDEILDGLTTPNKVL